MVTIDKIQFMQRLSNIETAVKSLIETLSKFGIEQSQSMKLSNEISGLREKLVLLIKKLVIYQVAFVIENTI